MPALPPCAALPEPTMYVTCYFCRAVEQGPSAVILTDADGAVRYVNPRFTRLTGYAPDEVIGEHIDRLGGPTGEERDRLWAILRGGGEWRGDFSSTRKDGEPYWVSASISALRDPDGTITHFLGCNEDITERKQAEEALQRNREELESNVERRMEQGSAYGLTFREFMILYLVAAGRLDREIAILLGISPRTVETHVTNILRKMQANTRTEAGVRALRERLID